nr:carbohydrate deacetylase isoform X2 [Geotrypetes seraphini]XP_033811413.1 carbohydrate deacetylase isoform X2 [Geotrypetes seraphini]XP_033811414.1 carbohydrate deacetylase isoform X2 [Geotrypetes seraphini]
MPQSRIKLIVTGDDFGYCPRRNQGIVDCFLANGISSASLLVNGTAAVDAAQLARRYNIPTGLHANLSEGAPVCTTLRDSSLLNRGGFFHGKMGIRKALAKGCLKMSEVKQELIAQVDLFIQLMGHIPHHMDGHQHIHVLPEIRHVFAEVLEKYSIAYSRIPIEPGLCNCDWIEQDLMEFYLGVEKDSINTLDVFTRHGIRWPEVYIGLTTMGRHMSGRSIQQAIDRSIAAIKSKAEHTSDDWSSLPAHSSQGRTISIELMVHPGYPSIAPEGGCGEGPDDFSQSWERGHEMQMLMAPAMQKYYRERNIQLCAFQEL